MSAYIAAGTPTSFDPRSATASDGLASWIRTGIVLLLVCIAIAVTFRAATMARGNSTSTIDIESVQVANDLYRNLISDHAVPRAASHYRMPGFALVLAVIATVDPNVRDGLACNITDRTYCRTELFASILVLQIVAAVASFAMLLLIAQRLSASWDVALIATVLTFIATRPGDFAGLVRPMVWYHFLLTLCLFLAVMAQRRSIAYSFGSGLALGISVLFEPTTALLIPIAAALFLLKGLERTTISRIQLLCAGAFLCGTATGLAGFVAAANLAYDIQAVLGHVVLHMAERVAFNAMDVTTWVQSLVVPIPLVGDWFQAFSGPVAVKFGVARPGAIAFDGLTKIYPESFVKGGSASGAAQWLVQEKIVGDAVSYVASIPSIVCRGIWAGGGVVALFGIFHVRRMLAYARADHRMTDHLTLLVPIAALFVLNILLTSNTYWMNPLVPFVYSYAIAHVASGI